MADNSIPESYDRVVALLEDAADGAATHGARTRLSGLRDELGQLIDDDDERWYAFGFSKPSDPDTPEVPENIVITPGAPGSHLLFVDWDDSLRATSYRVIVTNTATPPVDLKNMIVNESEATISDLAAGTAIKLTVASRNTKGGESAASPPVSATVP